MNRIAEKNDMYMAEVEQFNYKRALYHKMLDYHVTEILMATLGIGAIIVLRLHQ